MSDQILSKEASRKFGLAILAELGVDPKTVAVDSLQIERLGNSPVVIMWEGIAWMDFDRVRALLNEAQES